jgi:hypothetical protein
MMTPNTSRFRTIAVVAWYSLLFLLFSPFVTVNGWEFCNGTSGGVVVCPDGNLCCGNLCMSAVVDDQDHTNTKDNATCCTDDTTTGCGANYQCNTIDAGTCTALHPVEDHVPVKIPRNKLCSVTSAMTNVYAIPMINQSIQTSRRRRQRRRNENRTSEYDPTRHDDSTDMNHIPVATYLSTKGSIQDDATVFDQIKRVIVLIHGSRRNVEDYLCCVAAALPTDEDPTTTKDGTPNHNKNNDHPSPLDDPNSILILAPWFPTNDDGDINITATTSQKTNDAYTKYEPLRWIGNTKKDPLTIPVFHTWRYGAGAINFPDVSSYDVVDTIVTQYLYNTTKFPALQNIVVTGHSAGGQYVQRWALLTNSMLPPDRENDLNNDIGSFREGKERVPTSRGRTGSTSSSSSLWSTKMEEKKSPQRTYPVIRTVVVNPKSYAYMDGRRWMNTTTTKLKTSKTKTAYTTSILQFRMPTGTEIFGCETYNDWEWGFDHRSGNDALFAPYVQTAITVAGGLNVIVQRYATRNVIYLSGEEDVLYNGDCNDQIQGLNRRTRSERYYMTLQQYYTATDSSWRYRHQRYVVPNVPHNHCLMYQSIQGQQALFGPLNVTNKYHPTTTRSIHYYY